MYWEKIEGWFTFHRLYQTIVNNSNNNSIFIEIGTWKGKSTVFMAEKIKESNKQIKFYAIDTFEGTNNEHENYDCIQTKTLYEEYLKNIEPVKDYIITIKGNSNKVHEQFENDSIDFIFIDADHSYEAVKTDLKNWYSKIKSSGIIAGHDYNESNAGVHKAVNEFFNCDNLTSGEDRQSWIYKKI
jgi:predicted O-methyltransferase YrrM